MNTESKLFFAINFLWLDELLFGRADSQIDNWVLDRADDPPGITDNERVETRCTWWLVLNGICEWTMALTDNDIEMRSLCPEGQTFMVSGGYIEYAPGCGPTSGGSGGTTGSPGNIFNPSGNWFGGGGGSNGSGGVSGAPSNSIHTHPFLGALWQHCIQVELAANGENPGFNFTPEQLQQCQQLTLIVSQLIITPDHLAWLVQNNLTAFQAIANYLASPNITAFERQALSTYAALVATGQTTLPLRQFMTLYSLVYQQLTPALGLTADEAFHLLGEDNGALAQEIKLFLEEAASTQDQAEIEAAQVAANILIDLSMVNRENGPFDSAYQGVMDQYAPLFPEEQLDECCIGTNPFTDGVRLYLNAREEAFMLRTANPGWSERKI